MFVSYVYTKSSLTRTPYHAITMLGFAPRRPGVMNDCEEKLCVLCGDLSDNE
jgi:hypothetical protein